MKFVVLPRVVGLSLVAVRPTIGRSSTVMATLDSLLLPSTSPSALICAVLVKTVPRVAPGDTVAPMMMKSLAPDASPANCQTQLGGPAAYVETLPLAWIERSVNPAGKMSVTTTVPAGESPRLAKSSVKVMRAPGSTCADVTVLVIATSTPGAARIPCG